MLAAQRAQGGHDVVMIVEQACCPRFGVQPFALGVHMRSSCHHCGWPGRSAPVATKTRAGKALPRQSAAAAGRNTLRMFACRRGRRSPTQTPQHPCCGCGMAAKYRGLSVCMPVPCPMFSAQVNYFRRVVVFAQTSRPPRCRYRSGRVWIRAISSIPHRRCARRRWRRDVDDGQAAERL